MTILKQISQLALPAAVALILWPGSNVLGQTEVITDVPQSILDSMDAMTAPAKKPERMEPAKMEPTTTVISVVTHTVVEDYAMAAGYYARQQWAEAIPAFQHVLDNYPQSEQAKEANFFIAEAHMEMLQHREAFLAFQKFLGSYPNHGYVPRATFRMGEAAFLSGQIPQATRLIEQFLRANPENPLVEYALAYLGEIRLQNNEPQLAERVFEMALYQFPNGAMESKSRLGMAKALQLQGKMDGAIRFYKFVGTSNDVPRRGEANLQLGIIEFGERSYEDARSYLGSALIECADDFQRTEAAYWLARSEMELGNDERALRLFDEAARSENIKPELASAILFDGAIAAKRNGQEDVANHWLKTLREAYPTGHLTDDALQIQIDAARAAGNPDEAIALIGEFLENHRESEWLDRVSETLGRIYYSKEEYERSARVFEEMLAKSAGTKDPVMLAQRTNWKYLQSLGYLGENRFDAAEDILGSIPNADQSDELRPLIKVAYATSLYGAKKFDLAASVFEEYLRLTSTGEHAARAKADLSLSYAQLGQWDDTSEAFKRLESDHVGDPIVAETAMVLADSATKAGMSKSAVAWYQFLAKPGNTKEQMDRGLAGLAMAKMESQEATAKKDFGRLLAEHDDQKFSGDVAIARAKYLEDDKEYAKAAEMYGLIIEKLPESKLVPAAKLRRAYSLQKVGGRENLTKAKELLVDYLLLPKDQPALDEAVYQLGWIYHDLDLAVHGREKFAELVREYPDSKYWPDAAYRLAKFYVGKSNHEAAQPLIEKLLVNEAVPSQVLSRTMYLKGQMAANEGQWPACSVAMKELVQRTNKGEVNSDAALYGKASYWLAESLFRTEKYSEAYDMLRQMEADPKSLDPSLAPWIALRHSQCLAYLEKWEEAMAASADGKKRFPNFSADYEFDFVRGRALAYEGVMDDAIVAFSEVVNNPRAGKSETAAMAQWHIGETYFHKEEFEKAIKAYYRVDSLYPYARWRAASLMQAGKCQEHLGNWKHSVKLYSQLVEKYPASDFVDAARSRLTKADRQARKTDETKTKKR